MLYYPRTSNKEDPFPPLTWRAKERKQLWNPRRGAIAVRESCLAGAVVSSRERQLTHGNSTGKSQRNKYANISLHPSSTIL